LIGDEDKTTKGPAGNKNKYISNTDRKNEVKGKGVSPRLF